MNNDGTKNACDNLYLEPRDVARQALEQGLLALVELLRPYDVAEQRRGGDAHWGFLNGTFLKRKKKRL